jgi:8-amino-7-oxononanoate synthase
LTLSKAQDNIQHLVKHFATKASEDETLNKASDLGIAWVPLCDDWETREFLTHVIPIRTRDRYSYWLAFHLQLAGYSVYPIDYPVVPKGQSRVRVIVHGGNSEAEIESLIKSVSEWAQEMIDIETSAGNGPKVPKAAQTVYDLMASV